jgi:hypothetical protein
MELVVGSGVCGWYFFVVWCGYLSRYGSGGLAVLMGFGGRVNPVKRVLRTEPFLQQKR